MTAQTIGIGLLSFAHSHGEKWAESLRDDPRVDFVGAGDDDAERGERRTDKLGVTFWRDLDALLAGRASRRWRPPRSTPRTSSTLSEPPRRGGTFCARADRHCFARVRAAVERSGMRFMQARHTRLDPAHQEARRLLQSGARAAFRTVR